MSESFYRLEVTVSFIGPAPEPPRAMAREVGVAHDEAVDALRDVLAAHGLTVVSTGHGTRRIVHEVLT